MCMIDDADNAGFSVETWPRARVEHRCGECGRTIRPGERYERAFGVWDGVAETFKTCAHCCAARSWLAMVCDGWLYHGVHEDLSQHIREGSVDPWLIAADRGMSRRWGGGDDPLPAKTPAMGVLALFHAGPLSPWAVAGDDDDLWERVVGGEWPSRLVETVFAETGVDPVVVGLDLNGETACLMERM